MADANQLKRIEPIDYGEDDPFAELTRIMGFDPRVPVRPAAANQPVQAAAAPAAEMNPAAPDDDELSFDIDLERELLGGLLSDDEVPALAAPAASFDMTAPQPASADLDEDFDAAFAMEVGDLELDSDRVEAANDDIAFDFAEPAAAQDAEPVMEELPMAADRGDDDFGRVAAGNGAAPAAPGAAAAAHGRLDDEDDFAFDLAMAQVDMDFDAEASAPAHAAGEEADLDLFDEEAFEQALFLEPAVEEEFAYAVEEEPAFAVDAAPAEPMSAAPSMQQDDTTLEDELAALLGNPVAPAELAGSYDGEPLTAVLAAPAAPEDDLADFEAELAAWQPADTADDGIGEDAEPASFDAAAYDDASAYDDRYDAEAEYRSDDLGYDAGEDLADEDTADAETLAEEAAAGLESGAYADRYDAVAFDAEPDEPAADEAVVDPLAALRSMAADAGRGSASPAYAGYRSLATPTAAPSYPATQAYQYPAAAQSWSAPAEPSYAAAADPLDAYDFGATDDDTVPAGADEEVPEIDTVDVPEHAYAVADDLDLPELAFAVDDAPACDYDDFERDFAVAYSEPEPVDEGGDIEVGDLADYADTAFDSRPIEMGPAAVSTAGAAGWSHASVDRHLDDLDLELDAAANAAFADLGGFDGADIDERATAALPLEARRSDGARRGLMIAAIVGGVAVIGGIGAFALSYGDNSGSDVPVVVRADDTPVKVRPENPGGTVVPNQDNKVYQTVTGGVSAPSQEKLITSSEEPVDVADEALEGVLPLNEDDVALDPTAKSEDRVEPTASAVTGAAEEVAVVAPRKVRTMVVKPDGSLVPRDELVDETAVAVAEPRPGTEASAMEPAGMPAAADGTTLQAPAAAEPAKTKAPKAVEKTRTASIPDAGPVAPSRPADQPVDVVGEVKPDQVAAAGATAAAGAWSVQIASQPSEEAAKSTYQDLSRRYAGVIGGKGVTIVKAEISGKGTFYRVRVPAGSRSDAIALCETYKAAGGNCFVSK